MHAAFKAIFFAILCTAVTLAICGGRCVSPPLAALRIPVESGRVLPAEPGDSPELALLPEQQEPSEAGAEERDRAQGEKYFSLVVEGFNQALERHRFDEALRLAAKGKSIQPENPVADVMLLKAKIATSEAIKQLIAILEVEIDCEPATLNIAIATPEGDDGEPTSYCFNIGLPYDRALVARRLRRQLLSNLENSIRSLDQSCGLSDSQKLELKSAGLRDIQEFRKRVGDRAPLLRHAGSDDVHGSLYELREDDPLLRAVGYLDRELTGGLFGPVFRFNEATRTILTDEQRAKIRIANPPGSQEPAFTAETSLSLAGTAKTMLVISDAADGIGSSYGDVYDQLMHHVCRRLAEHGIRVVDPDEVERWWKKDTLRLKYGSLITATQADYVIRIDLDAYSLFEAEGTGLYYGQATVQLKVHQVTGWKELYSRELTYRFPQGDGTGLPHQSSKMFGQLFLSELSSEIGKLFYESTGGDQSDTH